MQHRPHLDILEVEREFFARKAFLYQAIRVFNHAFDFDDKTVFGLVRGMFPVACRCDNHTCTVTLLGGFNQLNRRAEVSDIEALCQIGGQVGIQKIHNDRTALLAQVYANLAVGQVNDHTTLTGVAATEVDITQAMFLTSNRWLGKSLPRRACCRSRDALQGDQHGLAVNLCFVIQGTRQFQHHARAIACLHHINPAHIAIRHVLHIFAECISGV